MSSPSQTRRALALLKRRQRLPLLAAGAAAAATTGSGVLLLGLSGWFIAAAAAAGAGGVAAITAFNYLLPSAGIRAFAILRTAGRYGERLASHVAALNAMADLRGQLFRRLASGPSEAALSLSTGEASARLIQDVDALEIYFVGLSATPGAVAAILAGLFMTGWVGPAPVLALLAGLVLQTVGGAVIGKRLSEANGAEGQIAMGRLKQDFNSFAAAAPELVCYGFLGQAQAAVMEASDRQSSARIKAARGDGALAALQAASSGGACIAVIAASGASNLAVTALAAFATLAAMDGASGLLRAFERKGAFNGAVTRLDQIAEPNDVEADLIPEPDAAITLHVNGADLTVKPADRLAIIGPSGGGKTRLIEALLKLRTVPDGLARIGGRDVASLSTTAVRDLFAYAPQNAQALSGTIRQNLLIGSPTATEAQLWRALHVAALDDRVSAMPLGLDTWIGEAGERLSGGERRRLALARSLLRPAPWLVLDEPTEGLDLPTEAEVVRRLEAHLRDSGQGLILVSHRDEPLRLCSRKALVA